MLFINNKICLFVNSEIGLVFFLYSITYFWERRVLNILYNIKKKKAHFEKTQISIFYCTIRFTVFN